MMNKTAFEDVLNNLDPKVERYVRFVNCIEELKIRSNLFFGRILGAKAWVWSSNKIFTKDHSTKEKFEAIRSNLVNVDKKFSENYSMVRLFLHELGHILQWYKYPIWKIFFFIIRDIFKNHDDKKLEIEADEFAKGVFDFSPEEVMLNIPRYM